MIGKNLENSNSKENVMNENALTYDDLLTIVNKPTFRYVNKDDILTIAKHFARLDRMTQMRIISEIPNLVTALRDIVISLRVQTETEIKAYQKAESDALKTLNRALDVCEILVNREDLTTEQITEVIDQIAVITKKASEIYDTTTEKIENKSDRFWDTVRTIGGWAVAFLAGIGLSQVASARTNTPEKSDNTKRITSRKNSSK